LEKPQMIDEGDCGACNKVKLALCLTT
jgi:hypothetical protein